MKIVVYQAVFGGRDDLRMPKFIPDDVHYYAIIGQGGKMDAQKIKLLPHRYFSEYDVSVWMDGNYELTGNIKEVVNRFMKHSDFAVLRHPAENLGIRPTVYREAEVAVLQGVERKPKIEKQIAFYRGEGLPATTEVVMNGILIRRHNELKVRAFDELWWREMLLRSSRDQISFPYLAWKHKLKYIKMDNVEFTSDWFVYRPHAKARKM
jgi:hypothetical protein